MKEEKLIEIIQKVEYQAKIFKSRKNKGLTDEKRHDLIKRDEQEWMWTAQDKLGWSNDKIGSTFGRDPRSVKGAVKGYKQGHPKITRNPHLMKHFDELAEAMRALYYLQQLLSNNPTCLIFRQLLPSNVAKFVTETVTGARFSPPIYFPEHFHQEFPELHIASWTDSFPGKVIDRLRYLGNAARFRYCPTCQGCKDVST